MPYMSHFWLHHSSEGSFPAACNLDLCELFPWIIQYQDALASGSVDAEGILHKITYALEQSTCMTELEIEHLATLLDADAADPDFLLYLSATLGTMVGEQSPLVGGLDYQRWLVRNLVAFYKIKGTHPSWEKRFQHHFLDGTLSYWYRAWELWKEIPHEVGNYSRYLDYTRQLRAARFDLYHLVDGSPVFLTPSEAEPYVPYIETARPIHVLLRHNAVLVSMTDTLATAVDAFTLTADQLEPELPPEFTDELGVALECGLACETGACEGYCELSCEGTACENACQTACTTGMETDPHPRDPTDPLSCLSSCEAGSCEGSSCETGSCEGSCQVESCQSGCQSASEVDKYPVWIEGTRGYNESHDGGATIYGRIWFPYSALNLSAINGATDVWWITAPDPAAAHTVTLFKRLGYDAVGAGHFGYDNAGTWEPSTLIPALERGVWTEVHCLKPVETLVTHAISGDGVKVNWTGDLQFQPHPGSVRFEAVLDEELQVITDGARQFQLSVTVADAAHDFRVGDLVQIYDDSRAESNLIRSITGTRLNLRYALRQNYDTTGAGRVFRQVFRQVAHTETLQTPTGNGLNDPWWGILGGDVDGSIDSWVNYRLNPAPTIDYAFAITWKAPPPTGAAIRIYYLPEESCNYYLEQTFQTIDSATFEVDTSSELGFRPAAVDNHIWVWNAATTSWIQSAVAAVDPVEGGTVPSAIIPNANEGWIYKYDRGGVIEDAHADPRDETIYYPSTSCPCVYAVDARGHVIGWWITWSHVWESPWGFGDPGWPY